MIKRFLVLTMHDHPHCTPEDSFGTFDSYDTLEEAQFAADALRSINLTILAIVEKKGETQ